MSLIVYFKTAIAETHLLDGFLYMGNHDNRKQILFQKQQVGFLVQKGFAFFSEHFFFQDQMLSVHFHPFCITESFLEFHSFITWCTSHVHVFFSLQFAPFAVAFYVNKRDLSNQAVCPPKDCNMCKKFWYRSSEGGGL